MKMHDIKYVQYNSILKLPDPERDLKLFKKSVKDSIFVLAFITIVCYFTLGVI